MLKNIFRRKIYFMKKSFQGKYIFYFFLLTIFSVAVFTIIFSMMSAGSTSIVYDNYNLKVGATPAILIKQILISNWVFIIIGGISVAVVTMFLMHRIAGPFYRFNMILKKMSNGDFSERLYLRKYDEGKIIADKFNKLSTGLSENIDSIKQLSTIIEENIGIIETKYGQDEAVKSIISANSRVLEILSLYKTKSS